jgi:diguanylate cyclase (GGDEF)-like protein
MHFDLEWRRVASRPTSTDEQLSKEPRLELHALLAEARRNEVTLRKFQSLELQLLASRSLQELLRHLLYAHRQDFDWDVVTLTLVDPEYEIRRLLGQSAPLGEQQQELVFVTDVELLPSAYRARRLPHLGAYDGSSHEPLFPRQGEPVFSVAILPLVRNDMLIGSLNIGSHSPRRFQAEAATDFLQHLAAVIAICLETTLNQERLAHAGLTDALTGINNRRFFDQRLPEEVARSQRTGQPLSALFVDIDRFKAINDTHGHLVGDKVLQTVAMLFREQLRSIDVVARYGGEEFAILLAGADADQAFEVAERIRRKVAERTLSAADETQLRVSISIGLADLPLTQGTHRADCAALGAQLMDAADRALYEAKRAGRDRVVRAP